MRSRFFLALALTAPSAFSQTKSFTFTKAVVSPTTSTLCQNWNFMEPVILVPLYTIKASLTAGPCPDPAFPPPGIAIIGTSITVKFSPAPLTGTVDSGGIFHLDSPFNSSAIFAGTNLFRRSYSLGAANAGYPQPQCVPPVNTGAGDVDVSCSDSTFAVMTNPDGSQYIELRAAATLLASNFGNDGKGAATGATYQFELDILFGSTGPVSNPFPPSTPTDHRFVITSGPGLKTACQKSGDGPLMITLPINRVVGDVDSTGLLTNVQRMLDNHVISKTAKLRIASLGMNSSATPSSARSDKIQ